MTEAEAFGPLLPDTGSWHERYETWAAVNALVQRLEDQLVPQADVSAKQYGWEPLPLVDFLTGLAICNQHARGSKLLGVGSGIGSKLHLAQTLGWDVRGLEIQPSYAEVSRRLFPDCQVEMGDCMEYRSYSHFDVIYSYCPFSDRDLEVAHYQTMVAQMDAGQFLFVPGGVDPDGLEHVDFAVWRKI